MSTRPQETARRVAGRPATLVLALALLGLPAAAGLRAEDAPAPPASDLVIGVFPASVASVVDGDTLRMEAGQPSVRVLGLDTEEVFKAGKDRAAAAADFAAYARARRGESPRPVKYGTPAGEAAREYVRELFAGVERVRLERDAVGAPERGRYGRRLAHVFLLREGGEVNLAEAVLRAGHSPYFVKYGRSTRFDALFAAAEDEARAAGRGIWGTKGPAHYPDYEERLAWWRRRADQVTRWMLHAAEPGHVTLGAPGANERLQALLGKEAVVFGLLEREFRIASGDRWILLLGHEPQRGLALVFFDEPVYGALDRAAVDSLYVTARGRITLYNGRPQIVIERPDQISTD